MYYFCLYKKQPGEWTFGIVELNAFLRGNLGRQNIVDV